MEFLKKHYEKMVLCLVLLGLAGAVLWMKAVTEKVKASLDGAAVGPPPRTAPPQPLDLSAYQLALAQMTNPPAVVLSGAHNLFNPVTWKRKANGDLLKIIKTGPDALMVTNIVPLYTVISYVNPIDGPIYVMGIQSNVDLTQGIPRAAKHVYPKLDEVSKNNAWPFVIRGFRGDATNPTELNLEITATGDTNVWVSTNQPYKLVESYYADLRYDPDPSLSLLKKRVKDDINLDNEPYTIVRITNDAVTVQSKRITKMTALKWVKAP